MSECVHFWQPTLRRLLFISFYLSSLYRQLLFLLLLLHRNGKPKRAKTKAAVSVWAFAAAKPLSHRAWIKKRKKSRRKKWKLLGDGGRIRKYYFGRFSQQQKNSRNEELINLFVAVGGAAGTSAQGCVVESVICGQTKQTTAPFTNYQSNCCRMQSSNSVNVTYPRKSSHLPEGNILESSCH